MPKLKIAPSILSAKKEKLQEEVDEIEKSADIIHVDIMDGKFVPPTTFTAAEIKAIKTKLPKDVHLMVEYPLDQVGDFADAGAKIITIHEECKDNIDETLSVIKEKGIKAGISINPPTPLEEIKPYLDKVDMVLIMSVNPGYSGQEFIEGVLSKIMELRHMKPEIDIEVDGGINDETIKKAVGAGANIIVAGSYIFSKKDRVKAIEKLREAAND
jgi:ribulose-phosphate 3-epimerase